MERPPTFVLVLAAALAAAAVGGACGPRASETPPIAPGTSAEPREVIVVAKDYVFVPPVLDLVAGETVTFQVVNGGLVVHEAVLGPMPVQDAWEAAEAPTVSAPPGPTPIVSVPPELAGLRIVVESGERRDVTWTVPADAPGDAGGWFLGCHIPGHWSQGMVAPVRFVDPGGALPTAPPSPTPEP